MASQMTPPADSRSTAASGPRAKPKSNSISTARKRTALKFAIVRRSVRRSFHATARARAISRRMDAAPHGTRDATIRELDDAIEGRAGPLEIVQHDDGRAAARTHVGDQLVDQRDAVAIEAVVGFIEQQEPRVAKIQPRHRRTSLHAR